MEVQCREVFEWEDTKLSVSHVPVMSLLLLNNLANLLTSPGVNLLFYKSEEIMYFKIKIQKNGKE